MLERELELARLLDALERSHQEGRAVVAVTGPMGIGKSRLLREFAATAEAAGHRVLAAYAGELERDYAWGVVLDLLERETVTDEPAVLERRFRGRAAVARKLLIAEPSGAQHPTAPTEEFALLHGLYWFAVNLAEERPLVLIVEDVHWADEPSLRFLLYLAQRLQGLPILLVLTARTGEVHASDDLVQRLLTTSEEEPITLSTLSEDAAARLLRSDPRISALSDSAIRESWAVTGGNPLLLDALRHALSSGVGLEIDGDPAEIRDFAPDRVQRELLQQVERLGEEALTLARACAVLGPQVAAVAVALSGLDEVDALVATERLAAADILVGGAELSFRHPMYRSAIYNALAPRERARLHAEAAVVLHDRGASDAHLARHLLPGASIGEPWAAAVLHRAARLAADRGAPSHGVRLLRRALSEVEDVSARAAILLDLALCEAASGEVVALTHFYEAAAAFGDQREKVDALVALSTTLYRYGRIAEAAETMHEACGIAMSSSDRELTATCKAGYYCAASYDVSLTHEISDAVRADAAPLLEKQDLTDAERALLATAVLRDFMEGAPAKAMTARARKALGSGALLRAQTSDSMVLYAPIEGLLYGGCLQEATEAIDEALDDARARGSNLAMGEASQLRAMIMLARGDLREAMSDARATLSSLEFGYGVGGIIPRVILAECLIEQGEIENAWGIIADTRPHGPAEEALQAHLACARGRILLLQGRAPEALEAFAEAGRLADRHGFLNSAIVPWRTRAARAAHLSGRSAEARSLVDESLRLARKAEAPIQIAHALRVKSEMVSTQEAVGLALEAVALLTGDRAQLDLAKAQLALGRIQRRLGQRTNAREHLRGALDLAHRCGATVLEAAVQEELRAAGARPRRQALTGLDSLTPAEHRVVVQAGRGLTNREIAEKLFVTKNTVDWHLRNAYGKLGVHSRAELVALLAAKE